MPKMVFLFLYIEDELFVFVDIIETVTTGNADNMRTERERERRLIVFLMLRFRGYHVFCNKGTDLRTWIDAWSRESKQHKLNRHSSDK